MEMKDRYGNEGSQKENKEISHGIFKVIFDKAKIDKQYYVYAIKSMLKTIDSQRHGSTMTHITKKDFEALAFPLPPLAEQKRIVEKLDKLLPLCKELTEDKLLKAI